MTRGSGVTTPARSEKADSEKGGIEKGMEKSVKSSYYATTAPTSERESKRTPVATTAPTSEKKDSKKTPVAAKGMFAGFGFGGKK